MNDARAVDIFFQLVIVGLALLVDLDIALAIVYKDADFTGAEAVADLNPDKLMILVDGLHAVAHDADGKVCFGRDRVLREAHQDKILLAQKLACTG